MSDLNITRNEGESFRDFHARAVTERALHGQKLTEARRETLAEILGGERYALLTVVNLNGESDESDGRTGTYVVQISMKFRGRRDLYWTTVVDGKTDHTLFEAQPRAILHALAVRAGIDVNEARFTVEAAARVLRIASMTD